MVVLERGWSLGIYDVIVEQKYARGASQIDCRRASKVCRKERTYHLIELIIELNEIELSNA
jgi:hypothetical protein